MQKVGTSSLWVEKFRPVSISDVIAPQDTINYLQKQIADEEIQNMLFYGSAGIGKTSAARALVKDIGGEELYLNGSIDTSIETVRDKVIGFATTHSCLMGGQKIVIIDECERLSQQGQDALKVVLEETESNCRFIFCTNNLQKIIKPLHSRCKLISFNYGKDATKEIMLQYFKRIQFVLDTEGIAYGDPEKKILAQFIQQFFPDFRKMLNELQGYIQSTGKIDIGLLKSGDNSQTLDLIELMRKMEFNKIRKICAEMDPDMFYQHFYAEIDRYIQPPAMLPVIGCLAEYGHKHCLCIDPEVNLVACCIELMQATKGQWK